MLPASIDESNRARFEVAARDDETLISPSLNTHTASRLSIYVVMTASLALFGEASALPPGFQKQAIYGNSGLPATIRFAPDGRLFVAEYFSGQILVYTNPPFGGHTVWATLSANTVDGVPGMAFHPSFPDSPYVYFMHASTSPHFYRVVRFTDGGTQGTDYTVIFDGIRADLADHHGGRLAFGPEGMLYVSIGDKDHPADAQDPANLAGKILRLDPMGLVPAGNPFGAGNPVFALGLRNPFGLTFDSLIGTGYLTENGPSCDDEVDLLVAGANYGWDENYACGSPMAGSERPLLSFTPTIAPVGCSVYRGNKYSQFDGQLFFGSYVDRAVRRVVFQSGNPATVESVEVFVDWPYNPTIPDENVLDVTTGTDGRLWVSTLHHIWRILEPQPAAVDASNRRVSFEATPNPFSHGILFAVPEATPLHRLEVLDIAGRRVRTWNGPIVGNLPWDGRRADGGDLAPGIYLARGVSAGGISIRRLVHLSP